MMNSMKKEINQSVYLWERKVHNFKKSKNFLTEYSQEQNSHWYYPRNTKRVQYYFHLRTAMVFYPNYHKFNL